jgi:hypothetical protein
MGALCCGKTVKVNYYSNNATSPFVIWRLPAASKDGVQSGLRAAEQVVDGRYGDGVAETARASAGPMQTKASA